MQIANLSNFVFSNYSIMEKYRFTGMERVEAGGTGPSSPDRSSVMIQSMQRIRVHNTGIDILELTQTEPVTGEALSKPDEQVSPVASKGLVPDIDQADDGIVFNGDSRTGLVGEAANGSEQESGKFMAHYKLKIMARDADGDKYKFMLHYKYKEIGVSSLNQTRVQTFEQKELELSQNANSNPIVAVDGIEAEAKIVEQGLNLVA